MSDSPRLATFSLAGALVLGSLPSLATQTLAAQKLDWAGFRGTHHDGVARSGNPPVQWDDKTNLKWKAPIGPGASSPIIVGDKVIVNTYRGYGHYLDDGGDKSKLEHVLMCFDRATGDKQWEQVTKGPLEKEARRMQLTEHGFASPTPVCDGEVIYSYLGKPGIIAVDMKGKRLWQTDLGTPDPKAPKATNTVVRNGQTLSLRWGTAASPILFEELVIVNCSEQSNSIRALDRKNGKLVWKREHGNLEGSAITPMIAGKGDNAVLVIALGGSIWGLAPKTGKLLWEVETGTRGGMSPTPVADDKLVYAFGGMGKGFALQYGAKIDPSLTTPLAKPGKVENADASGVELPAPTAHPRIAWRSANVGIPSPTLYKGKIFMVDQTGKGTCVDARSGEVLFEERLKGRTGKLYASATVAGGHLYLPTHRNGIFVYKADATMKLVAHNELEDDSKFNGSPAVAGDELFVRSDKFLYCFANAKKK